MGAKGRAGQSEQNETEAQQPGAMSEKHRRGRHTRMLQAQWASLTRAGQKLILISFKNNFHK